MRRLSHDRSHKSQNKKEKNLWNNRKQQPKTLAKTKDSLTKFTGDISKNKECVGRDWAEKDGRRQN